MIMSFSTCRPDRRVVARRLFDQGRESADPLVRMYGNQSWGQQCWELGQIGAAFRYLSEDHHFMLDAFARRADNPLRHDVLMFGPMLRGVLTTMHGDSGAAQALFETIENVAGDDLYSVTVWAHFASMAAAMAGDTGWALRAAERWLAADPQHFFDNVDHYLRVTWCWARALNGDDPARAAAEAETVVATRMLEPPLYGIPFHYGLVAEMFLAAGMPVEAGHALDKAFGFLDTRQERYSEGLLLLLRAKLLEARGEPVAVVRAAGEKARELSAEQGAHLFARRAEEFLAG